MYIYIYLYMYVKYIFIYIYIQQKYVFHLKMSTTHDIFSSLKNIHFIHLGIF